MVTDEKGRAWLGSESGDLVAVQLTSTRLGSGAGFWLQMLHALPNSNAPLPDAVSTTSLTSSMLDDRPSLLQSGKAPVPFQPCTNRYIHHRGNRWGSIAQHQYMPVQAADSRASGEAC